MKVSKITGADGTVYELPNIDTATIQSMIDTAIRAEREREHPVGSFWIREVDIDPAIYFGFGTWQQIEGQFLLGASSDYPAGTTGGSATHKHATEGHSLTIAQMPSHRLTFDAYIQPPTQYQGGVDKVMVYGKPAGTTFHNWNTDYIGGNQPHDHGDTTDGSSMPPYMAVYIWQRTA